MQRSLADSDSTTGVVIKSNDVTSFRTSIIMDDYVNAGRVSVVSRNDTLRNRWLFNETRRTDKEHVPSCNLVTRICNLSHLIASRRNVLLITERYFAFSFPAFRNNR